MKYDVEYDGEYTMVFKHKDGEFKTLKEAKKEAVRHLNSLIVGAKLQIKSIRNMKKDEVETPL